MNNPAVMDALRAVALFVVFISTPSLGDEEVSTGDYFTVGTYQLAYHCAGTGGPPIFLETPSGLSAEESFSKIFDDIAANNRVCRFDRLGMGLSDPVPAGLNQTVHDYAAELSELIEHIAPDDPVILVGYSFGGLVARYYASHSPDRVIGILLIDAAHEDWLREMKRQMSEEDWQKMQEILDWFMQNLGHNYWDSQVEIEKSPPLRADLPVRVISRGLDFQRIRLAEISEEGFRIYNDLHNKYQLAQASLTERTTRVVATKSEHYIPDTEPELVIEELTRLLQEAD